MTQFDVIIVNYLFNEREAATYIAASILSKAILYLPGGLVLAMFPIVATQNKDFHASIHILIKTSFLALFFCGSLAFALWFLSPYIVSYFLGSDFEGLSDLVGPVSIAFLPLALILISEHYAIAMKKVVFAWVFIGLAPIQIITMMIFNDEIINLAICIGFFGFLSLIIGYGYIFIKIRN